MENGYHRLGNSFPLGREVRSFRSIPVVTRALCFVVSFKGLSHLTHQARGTEDLLILIRISKVLTYYCKNAQWFLMNICIVNNWYI